MQNRVEETKHFFSNYAAIFNYALQNEVSDIDAITQSFASCFIEASPTGVSCGKNDEVFQTMIPQGYEFYKSIGIAAMNILSADVTLLDEWHSIAKVRWQSVYTRKDETIGSIEFDVIYLLQFVSGSPKIFAYIIGDEQKNLKDRGLI